MERFTDWIDDAKTEVSVLNYKMRDAMLRLATYEDTGLMPEEIINGQILTGWIPITERIPEYEDKYWCTFSDGTTGTCLFMIWRNGGAFNISGCATRIDPNLSVIAWMPLLPAYQPPTLEASGRYADNDILMPAT